MNNLAQHIEVLLLENDCVIVPGLGGFVAHYAPASYLAEEGLFLPPARIIGYNPQLKMNDGLLAQSYMTVYNTNFSDATRIIEKEVEELYRLMHEEGKVELENIGELRYSIHGVYEFFPYDNKVTTPFLYGLGSFEMQTLEALHPANSEKIIPLPRREEKREKTAFSINRSYLSGVAGMVAAILLCFFISTPIQNTEVVEGNYAQLLPAELFELVGEKALTVTPIVAPQKEEKKKEITPKAVKEVKVAQAEPTVSPTPTPVATSKATVSQKAEKAPKIATSAKRYHIIVASVGTERDAEAMAKRLQAEGYAGAQSIIGSGKMRVSIESCATHAEATQTLEVLREKNNSYKDAWILRK